MRGLGRLAGGVGVLVVSVAGCVPGGLGRGPGASHRASPGATASAARAPGTWRVMATGLLGHGTSWHEVRALAEDDIWVAGVKDAGPHSGDVIAAHWDGKRWRRYRLPQRSPESEVDGLGATGAGDAWMTVRRIGSRPEPRRRVPYRFDGHGWHAAPARGFADDADGAGALASVPGATWVLVDKHTIGRAHGDGWARTTVTRTGTVTALTARTRTDAWATGRAASSGPLALHWNGRTWDRTRTPDLTCSIDAVTIVARDDAWAVCHSAETGAVPLRWNGRMWRKAGPRAPDPLFRVSASARRGLWATLTIPRPGLRYFDGRRWAAGAVEHKSDRNERSQGVWDVAAIPGSSSVIAVGDTTARNGDVEDAVWRNG